MTTSSVNRHTSQAIGISQDPDGQTILVDVRRLKACRYQRRTVTPDRVRPLAETIRQNGLLQNVTARPMAGDPDYDCELIAGHRRTAAFCLLLGEAKTQDEREKWSRIPCTMKVGLSEVQVAALAAIENLERDDGDVLEQALSLLEVKKAGGFSNNTQVAEATGINQQRVTRLLRLAEAPEVLRKAVVPGVRIEVTEKDGTTRYQFVKLELTLALAVVPYYRFQENAEGRSEAIGRTERLLQRIARGNWPRTRVEAEVKRLLGSRPSIDEPQGTESTLDEVAAVATPSTPVRKQLFRDKGVQFVIYPNNLETASEDDRQALLGRLKMFVAAVESTSATRNDDATATKKQLSPEPLP